MLLIIWGPQFPHLQDGSSSLSRKDSLSLDGSVAPANFDLQHPHHLLDMGGHPAVPKGLPLVASNTTEYALQTAHRDSQCQGTGSSWQPPRKYQFNNFHLTVEGDETQRGEGNCSQLLRERMSDPEAHTAYPLFYCPPHPHDQTTMDQASCRELGFSRKQTDLGPILEELSPVGAMNTVIMFK